MLNSKTAKIFSWLLFACCFVGACVFIEMHIDQHINSDMSSDLLRAQLFAPFFHLTQNWHVIRVAGTAICYALLMFSLWFLCRETKQQRVFPLAGAFFLLPLSDPYFDNIIKGVHYIPYVACAFLIFGLFFFLKLFFLF